MPISARRGCYLMRLRPGNNASPMTLLLCFTHLRCSRTANRRLTLGGRKIERGRHGCDAPCGKRRCGTTRRPIMRNRYIRPRSTSPTSSWVVCSTVSMCAVMRTAFCAKCACLRQTRCLRWRTRHASYTSDPCRQLRARRGPEAHSMVARIGPRWSRMCARTHLQRVEAVLRPTFLS